MWSARIYAPSQYLHYDVHCYWRYCWDVNFVVSTFRCQFKFIHKYSICLMKQIILLLASIYIHHTLSTHARTHAQTHPYSPCWLWAWNKFFTLFMVVCYFPFPPYRIVSYLIASHRYSICKRVYRPTIYRARSLSLFHSLLLTPTSIQKKIRLSKD